jgi:hypothetical protein
MRHLAWVGLFALVVSNCLAQQIYKATSRSLPEDVLKWLAGDEQEYCEKLVGLDKKDCHKTFRANLHWRELQITPSGEVAILVENATNCESTGCALKLFAEGSDGRVVQILGTHGDVGSLGRTELLKNTTKGHFDLQLTLNGGETHKVYRWHRFHYVAQ